MRGGHTLYQHSWAPGECSRLIPCSQNQHTVERSTVDISCSLKVIERNGILRTISCQGYLQGEHFFQRRNENLLSLEKGYTWYDDNKIACDSCATTYRQRHGCTSPSRSDILFQFTRNRLLITQLCLTYWCSWSQCEALFWIESKNACCIDEIVTLFLCEFPTWGYQWSTHLEWSRKFETKKERRKSV